MSKIELLPAEDPYNLALIDQVHPPNWQNPTPSGTYNLVVIGAGSAGLTAAAAAVALGASVAIIEKGLMGGDCLNVGCVPSKAVIRSGRAMQAVKAAAKYGIQVPDGVEVDFGTVMRRMRAVRAEIAPHDSAHRYTKMGVDVYLGTAHFTGPHALEIDGQALTFSKAIISTGSRPADLPIPGIQETGYLTNETVFNLTEQPRRLALIGAGPIGSELAQTFQRLGTQVTLIDIAPQILGREDQEAAALVQKVLVDEGIHLLMDTQTQKVALEDGAKALYYKKDGTENKVVVDEILIAVGRKPNIEGLNLEAANVNYDKHGIKVDDQLKTSNDDIYAAGDVALKYQFTHVAGHAAAIALQNALFPFPKRNYSDLVIPWVTYTEPEVAHVGMYAHEAEEKGIKIDTYHIDMAKVDRFVADGDEGGFVKIHVKKGTDEILGATVVNNVAGEMISTVTLAMKHKLGLGALASLVYPYPTQSEGIYKAANEYNKTRLTRRVKQIFNWWFKRIR